MSIARLMTLAVAVALLVALGGSAAMAGPIGLIDDFSTPAVSWAQLQTGYWLLHTERTIFTATELNQGKYKVRALEGIVVQQP